MKRANGQRTVLITGVTRGLGLAMAEEFARLGHIIVGCGRSKSEIEKLRAKLAPPHDFAVVDVASDAEVKTVGKSPPRLARSARSAIEQCRRDQQECPFV